MVFGAKAIVDKVAVVVIVGTAFIAYGTMERAITLNELVENTQVVQVNVVFKEIVDQPNEIVFFL